MTHMNKFAEPPCMDSEVSALSVHAVMQVVALYQFDDNRECFELSVEPLKNSTRRSIRKIPRIIVEG